MNEQQIATDMNVLLSGSFQVTPNFWADPKTGIPYQVWVQTPEYRNDTLTAITNTPLLISAGTSPGPSALQLLSNVATLTRGSEQTVSTHVNTQPTFDVYAAVQDRDLGGLESDINQIVADQQKQLEPPDHIAVRGQIQSKDQAFFHIGIGLIVAMVAVYLLMAINFQTWGDPFVVLAALPLAFCGIVASLFITQTTFSIPSLMGAIMSVGVASANSILLVTFAREHRESTGSTAIEAAIAAGETRLRPVPMTAGAMFVGLLPMVIGIGQGASRTLPWRAPCWAGSRSEPARLLLFVPFLYALLRRGEAKPLEDYV